MVKMTKMELEGKKEQLVKMLDGNAVMVHWVEGKATNTGRSDYIQVVIYNIKEGYFYTPYTTSFIVAKIFGYRFNENKNAMLLTGCGYNKSHEIYTHLKDFMLKNNVTCNSIEYK